MTHILVPAIAVCLISTAATAEAASRHKGKSYQPRDRMTWNAPVAMRRVGPPWAMPNECYLDEGYGRYLSCDTARR